MLLSGRIGRRAAIAAVGLAALVSGCADTEVQSDTAFSEDIAHWKMPLDDYYLAPPQQAYAVSLMTAACMKRAGVSGWPLEDPAELLPPVFSERARRLFNLQIASEYGYHTGNTAFSFSEPPEAPKLTAEQESSLGDCQREAHKSFGVGSQSLAKMQGLAGAAAEKALRDPEVVSAAAEWRDCMLPLGLSDLPEAPLGSMPTQTQRDRFGMADTDPMEVKRRDPTPDELREAKFDAECRESSGYTKTLYEAEVELNQSAIRDNADLASRARDESQRLNANIREVIVKSGRPG